MNTWIWISTLFLQAAAATFAAENPVVAWISTHSVRLETPEAGHGFADMQPLKKVIGNARIVSLGEATHGTREFFQLKHRMLEFLATEMGFTIFSIEANMPEAYRLNDFVLNGNGDARQLRKGMYFWTWNTEEVLDMILWMREFNKSGKGRVEFTGFDMQTPDVAFKIASDFLEKNDADYTASADFRKASQMALARPKTPDQAFGVATATFPVAAAAGKTIRSSGYIKTENVTTGFAGFWWRVDGPTGMLAFDNMQDRGVTGTTDWKRYTIELPVAENAKNINFGAILPGNGTAWFDGLTVEIDGKPYVNGDLFDLDFESESPKGFYTGGDGYQVELDRKVVHDGKQSLRMKRLGPPKDVKTAENSVDSKAASAAWQDVVRHMESAREQYRARKAADRDTEWAIQNARVVRQCMQMRAMEITRDRSMADNVAWILEQNPKAKIVLWAHNGHVAKTAEMFESMGSWLGKKYGSQMVVFGFAFNEGSFQAMKSGKGLQNFTVSIAPAESLDATLAAAGIPLFALDLREAPADGPVAQWIAAPHKSRSIGAIYAEGAPGYFYDMKARDQFDVLLFVEKTTAARKNP